MKILNINFLLVYYICMTKEGLIFDCKRLKEKCYTPYVKSINNHNNKLL